MHKKGDANWGWRQKVFNIFRRFFCWFCDLFLMLFQMQAFMIFFVCFEKCFILFGVGVWYSQIGAESLHEAKVLWQTTTLKYRAWQFELRRGENSFGKISFNLNCFVDVEISALTFDKDLISQELSIQLRYPNPVSPRLIHRKNSEKT